MESEATRYPRRNSSSCQIAATTVPSQVRLETSRPIDPHSLSLSGLVNRDHSFLRRVTSDRPSACKLR